LSFGCVEKRADTAHTARIKTGGTVPALQSGLEHSQVLKEGLMLTSASS